MSVCERHGHQPVYQFRWLVPDKYIYEFTLTTPDGQFVVNENLKVVIEGNGVTEEFAFDRGSEDVRIDTADSQYLIHVHIHKIDSVERTYAMSVYFDGIKYGETEVLLKGQEPPGQLPRSRLLSRQLRLRRLLRARSTTGTQTQLTRRPMNWNCRPTRMRACPTSGSPVPRASAKPP